MFLKSNMQTTDMILVDWLINALACSQSNTHRPYPCILHKTSLLAHAPVCMHNHYHSHMLPNDVPCMINGLTKKSAVA